MGDAETGEYKRNRFHERNIYFFRSYIPLVRRVGCHGVYKTHFVNFMSARRSSRLTERAEARGQHDESDEDTDLVEGQPATDSWQFKSTPLSKLSSDGEPVVNDSGVQAVGAEDDHKETPKPTSTTRRAGSRRRKRTAKAAQLADTKAAAVIEAKHKAAKGELETEKKSKTHEEAALKMRVVLKEQATLRGGKHVTHTFRGRKSQRTTTGKASPTSAKIKNKRKKRVVVDQEDNTQQEPEATTTEMDTEVAKSQGEDTQGLKRSYEGDSGRENNDGDDSDSTQYETEGDFDDSDSDLAELSASDEDEGQLKAALREVAVLDDQEAEPAEKAEDTEDEEVEQDDQVQEDKLTEEEQQGAETSAPTFSLPERMEAAAQVAVDAGRPAAEETGVHDRMDYAEGMELHKMQAQVSDEEGQDDDEARWTGEFIHIGKPTMLHDVDDDIFVPVDRPHTFSEFVWGHLSRRAQEWWVGNGAHFKNKLHDINIQVKKVNMVQELSEIGITNMNALTYDETPRDEDSGMMSYEHVPRSQERSAQGRGLTAARMVGNEHIGITNEGMTEANKRFNKESCMKFGTMLTPYRVQNIVEKHFDADHNLTDVVVLLQRALGIHVSAPCLTPKEDMLHDRLMSDINSPQKAASMFMMNILEEGHENAKDSKPSSKEFIISVGVPFTCNHFDASRLG